jgi:hypothetical protein
MIRCIFHTHPGFVYYHRCPTVESIVLRSVEWQLSDSPAARYTKKRNSTGLLKRGSKSRQRAKPETRAIISVGIQSRRNLWWTSTQVHQGNRHSLTGLCSRRSEKYNRGRSSLHGTVVLIWARFYIIPNLFQRRGLVASAQPAITGVDGLGAKFLPGAY